MANSRSSQLYPVDLERFWADDRASHGKHFSTDKPQVPLGIHMPAQCIYDELGLDLPADAPAEFGPYEVPVELRRAYNEKARTVVGRAFFPEDDPPPADARFPALRGLTDIFEAPVRQVGGTDWVMQAADTPAELEALLDRVEGRDLRSFVVPDNWESEVQRIYGRYGRKPGLGAGVRGPVTAAMSIYGVENLIYLIMDEPELAARFAKVMADVIIGLGEIWRELSGQPDRRGWHFNDDDCCLLNAELYEFWAQPILRRVFDTFSPDPSDWRFQHSDSAMGHLMPLLREVGLRGANFGPTVPAAEIRAAMPETVIFGQLAPWTFARGTDDEVAAEVRRDIQQAAEGGGLVIATAGSINPGSLLSGLRAAMSVIQNEGRYQPL